MIVDARRAQRRRLRPRPIAIGRDFSTRPEVRQALAGAEVSGTRVVGDAGHEPPLRRAAGRIGRRHPGRGAHHVPAVGRRRPDPPHLAAARGDRWRRARHRVPGQPAARRLDDQAARRPRDGRRRAGRGRAVGARRGAQGPRRAHRARGVVQRDRGAARAARRRAAGFVADASHQLRTPLAALRLRLENLEADVDGAAAEDLEGALAEVSRLSRLVDGLLVLARAEQSTSDPAPVEVEDVLDGRCDAWEAFAAEKHVHIDASVAGHPGGVRDAGAPRAGRRQPPEQRARGRAPRERGAASSPGAAATGSSCGSATRGPGCRPRSAPARSTGSGSRARRGATVAPTVTSASGSSIVRELVVGDGGDVALDAVGPAGSRSSCG